MGYEHVDGVNVVCVHEVFTNISETHERLTCRLAAGSVGL